ncbi:DMT family transporter [Pseudoalteromonas sp. C2R02]|uniref:DMT family transporter n=1 Tax=Pseudoalteromonas sp. C2R02 TaxID=2841565 RepID=UPI001C08CA89|nr:DMT family transporter [Pseudoalteromonas sp. C2R02]MBU2970885.1 DMT family transporter [Pseudoalteromonas sp. C2R02]
MSNFGVYLLLPISLLIGISLASQAGVNSQLRLALSNPIQAAFISFLFGTIILGIVAFIQGDAWLKPGSLAQIPWWAWIGGLLGAFNIAMSIFLAPKLGALVLAVSVVCGQVIASLALDHNGWLGYPKIEINTNRIIGALFVVIGLVLVAKK